MKQFIWLSESCFFEVKEQRACIHQKEKNQRQDRLHKLTTKLVRDFDVIVLEDTLLMWLTCLFLLLFQILRTYFFKLLLFIKFGRRLFFMILRYSCLTFVIQLIFTHFVHLLSLSLTILRKKSPTSKRFGANHQWKWEMNFGSPEVKVTFSFCWQYFLVPFAEPLFGGV